MAISEEKAGIAVAVVAGLMFATLLITSTWDKRDERRNAFAKECNERGGSAVEHDGMLQCLGAKRAATNPETKPS